MEQLRVSIVPAGEFGASLAVPFSENVEEVVLFDRKPDRERTFNLTRIHHAHPDVVFPDNVIATSNLAEAVQGADIVVFAARSKEAYKWYQELAKVGNGEALLLSVVKGLFGNRLISEMLEEVTPGIGERLAVLSGPNFASDIAGKRKLVRTVIASQDNSRFTHTRALSTPLLEVLASTDYIGTQMGGAWKNPYGNGGGIIVAAGAIPEELEAYKEACLAEMTTVGIVYGALPETFQGLAGKGDLDITCSHQSRNFKAGYMLGSGISPQALIASGETYEGLYAARGAVEMARKKSVRVPIMEMLDEIINGEDTGYTLKQFAEQFVKAA